tara:strand:- start:7500 stop:7745 length:246 start_codon:yes stop_codon:yes gene_type:complete
MEASQTAKQPEGRRCINLFLPSWRSPLTRVLHVPSLELLLVVADGEYRARRLMEQLALYRFVTGFTFIVVHVFAAVRAREY